MQDSYKNREQLFTQQRRKVIHLHQTRSIFWIVRINSTLFARLFLQVDLKSFANWEDSPEKMMMDMVSNPNAVRREDR